MAGKPMPDELARRYTPSEFAAIEDSVAPHKIDTVNAERLQTDAQQFQRTRLEESNDTTLNRSRRRRLKLLLKRVIELCEQAAPESDIKLFLADLAPPFVITVETSGHLKIKQAAETLLARITKRGPKPKKARQQFVRFLVDHFERITGRAGGRSVHDVEQGDLRRFVIAALEPFKETHGCEAVIKNVLAERRKLQT